MRVASAIALHWTINEVILGEVDYDTFEADMQRVIDEFFYMGLNYSLGKYYLLNSQIDESQTTTSVLQVKKRTKDIFNKAFLGFEDEMIF